MPWQWLKLLLLAQSVHKTNPGMQNTSWGRCGQDEGGDTERACVSSLWSASLRGWRPRCGGGVGCRWITLTCCARPLLHFKMYDLRLLFHLAPPAHLRCPAPRWSTWCFISERSRLNCSPSTFQPCSALYFGHINKVWRWFLPSI